MGVAVLKWERVIIEYMDDENIKVTLREYESLSVCSYSYLRQYT